MSHDLLVPVNLTLLEKQAAELGLLLRIQVNRPLNLWSIRLVVAEPVDSRKIRILGEMKAWAYGGERGMQIDTIRVKSKAPLYIGHLLWAAMMAWTLENTPCKFVRLLAVCDEEKGHGHLVRYFRSKGFKFVREVSSNPFDLPLRLVWGGAGTLMNACCEEVHNKSCLLWKSSKEMHYTNYSVSA